MHKISLVIGDQVRIETETVAWYIANPLCKDGIEVAFGFNGKANRILKKVTYLDTYKERIFSAKPKDAKEVSNIPFRYPTNKGKKWTELKRAT